MFGKSRTEGFDHRNRLYPPLFWVARFHKRPWIQNRCFRACRTCPLLWYTPMQHYISKKNPNIFFSIFDDTFLSQSSVGPIKRSVQHICPAPRVVSCSTIVACLWFVSAFFGCTSSCTTSPFPSIAWWIKSGCLVLVYSFGTGWRFVQGSGGHVTGTFVRGVFSQHGPLQCLNVTSSDWPRTWFHLYTSWGLLHKRWSVRVISFYQVAKYLKWLYK